MKTCGRCNIEKDKSLFAKRSKSKDGLSNWCKECFKAYDRERYINGDKARKDTNRANRLIQVHDRIWGILTNSCCLVCGNDDPEVLEFDHREQSSKEFTISMMFRSYSWSRIQKEIDKCDILCANCHRKRTIRQLDTWRGKRI